MCVAEAGIFLRQDSVLGVTWTGCLIHLLRAVKSHTNLGTSGWPGFGTLKLGAMYWVVGFLLHLTIPDSIRLSRTWLAWLR